MKGWDVIELPSLWKNDMENIKLLADKGLTSAGEIIVYSNLPLYLSRATSKQKKGKHLGSTGGEKYQMKEKDGLTVVYSDKPLSFIKEMKSFRKMGFRNFQVDLSGESGDHGGAGAILGEFKRGELTGEALSLILSWDCNDLHC